MLEGILHFSRLLRMQPVTTFDNLGRHLLQNSLHHLLLHRRYGDTVIYSTLEEDGRRSIVRGSRKCWSEISRMHNDRIQANITDAARLGEYCRVSERDMSSDKVCTQCGRRLSSDLRNHTYHVRDAAIVGSMACCQRHTSKLYHKPHPVCESVFCHSSSPC